MSARPFIGLSGVKYSLLTEASDTVGGSQPTYGTIYDLPGAMEMKWDPNASAATLFADDGAYTTAETVGDMKVTMKLADAEPADYARLLGHTYSNGQIVEKTTDASPFIALMFKALRAGSSVYEYFCIYKLKLSKPSLDSATKGASINYQNPSFEGHVVKLNYNDSFRLRMRTDDATADATTLANFFTAIPFSGANLNALTCTIAEGTAGNAGKIEFTFAKAGGASFSMDSATCVIANLITTIAAGGICAGAFTVAGAGTTVIVRFTPTTPYGSAARVGVTVSGAKDTSGVSVTPTGKVITIA